VLSGSGPSLLAAVRGAAQPVARAMEGVLTSTGLLGRALPLPVDTVGATWNRRP